jgi:peptide/nickel transport system substrate-binding protein
MDFQSPLSRRNLLALGGGAVASAALLTACSRSGTGSGSGAADGPPRPGGTFTFYGPTGVNTNLDLHNTMDPATYRYITPLCSKLVELKTGPNLGTSTEVVPDLAEKWEVSEDGLTYTFHLRGDVTWHNIPPVNGRPFSSDDVIATFESIIRRPALWSWMFEHVADLRAPDARTVVIRLKQVYAPFLTYMAHTWNVILPREHIEKKFDIENMVIGTGPFMLKSYKRGEQMTRVRNPNYFIKGKPYLDELNHVVIPEQNAAIAAFLSGRIDTTGVPAEQIDEFKDRPDVELRKIGFTPVDLYLQMKKKPFDDLRVRRAVAMAINFEGLGQTVYPDHWQLSSNIPPHCGDFALSPEEIKKIRPYDPAQSRQLLAAAGYPDGFDTSMLVQRVGQADVDGAEYMVQDLKEVGINVKLQVQDAATAVERRRNGQFDMAKAIRSISLPDGHLRDYETGGPANYAQISDPKLDAMIEQSRQILDHQQQVAKFHEIATYMETEISAAIFGLGYTSTVALRSNVHNYYPHQIITGRWYGDVWVDG